MAKITNKVLLVPSNRNSHKAKVGKTKLSGSYSRRQKQILMPKVRIFLKLKIFKRVFNVKRNLTGSLKISKLHYPGCVKILKRPLISKFNLSTQRCMHSCTNVKFFKSNRFSTFKKIRLEYCTEYGILLRVQRSLRGSYYIQLAKFS